jgi:hypothetical protein
MRLTVQAILEKVRLMGGGGGGTRGGNFRVIIRLFVITYPPCSHILSFIFVKLSRYQVVRYYIPMVDTPLFSYSFVYFIILFSLFEAYIIKKSIFLLIH